MAREKIVVIGGTGTLGGEVLRRLHEVKCQYDIHVASRGEHKQQEFKKLYPNFRFHICDIRDASAIDSIIKGSDIVFNFAALKAIDVCEDNPIECLKTNTLGAINVAESCIKHKVDLCVFSSTDKAVDPISSYGYAKALSEKILHDFNKKQKDCKFLVFRWGNVIGSNGSVIPFFIDRMRNNLPVYLTDPRMTRFFIKIDSAVDFMFNEISRISDDKETPKTALIPSNIKSTSVHEIISALNEVIRPGTVPDIIETGIRGCEKIHEQMRSIHEQAPIDSTDFTMTRRELMEILEPLLAFKD